MTSKVENPKKQIESDQYDFTHAKRGLAIIINNEDFRMSKDFGDRPGSSYDASGLERSFRRLRFDVMLLNNLTGMQMIEVLRNGKFFSEEAIKC